MTYKDKGSYESWPPCMNAFMWMSAIHTRLLTRINASVVTSHVFMTESYHTYECTCGKESCLYASVISHIWTRLWRRVMSLCMSHLMHMDALVVTSHWYIWIHSWWYVWMHLWLLVIDTYGCTCCYESFHTYECSCSDTSECTCGAESFDTYACACGNESFVYAWVISHIWIRLWRRVMSLCMILLGSVCLYSIYTLYILYIYIPIWEEYTFYK